VTLSAIKPELRELPLGVIVEPALPSRTTMDEDNMEKLVASIRAHGFFSVLVVVLVGDVYEVVAGHRRRIAAGRAGLLAVPCLVYPSKAAALEAIQHAENKLREDLNPGDEAIWFAQLLEAHPDEGTDGVAARVNESRGYVEGMLALLSGDEKVFADLAAGRIAKGVAQQLNRCTDPLHRNMLRHNAVNQGATVAVVSSWIRDWKRNVEPYVSADAGAGAVSTGTPVLENEYFRCRLCGETENPAHLQPVQMHDYCVKAIFDPAMRQYRSRGDVVEFPRTREAAVELVDRILERFPELGNPTP
jgi:ParB/RepB/Spo0J family partition protein